LSFLDLGLTILTVVVWGMITPADFAVFCSSAGCFQVPVEGITKATVSYSWGLWVLRAAVQAVVSASLFRLAQETAGEFSHDSPSASVELGEVARAGSDKGDWLK
jgi:hypothetical protein